MKELTYCNRNPMFRYYPQKHRFSLENFDLIDVESTPTGNLFIRPFSWKASVGIKRIHFAKDDRPLVGQFKVGARLSYDLPGNILAHAYLRSAVVISDRFKQYIGLGAGFGMSIYKDFSKSWRTNFTAQGMEFFQRISQTSYALSLHQRFTLWENSALRLSLSERREFGNSSYK